MVQVLGPLVILRVGTAVSHCATFMHLYTCTQTHMYHTHVHNRKHTHTCTHVCTHARTHARTHAHTHTHTHTHKHTNTHTHTYTQYRTHCKEDWSTVVRGGSNGGCRVMLRLMVFSHCWEKTRMDYTYQTCGTTQRST